MTCQSCGSTDLSLVYDFGSMPLCNAFLSGPNDPEKPYPLRLVRCLRCGLAQLSEVPPASEVFGKSFNYLSSSSKGVVKHYSEMARRLAERYSLGSKDLVVDIASNDGVLLEPFKEMGIRTFGVEPVERIAQIATSKGMMTIAERFEDADIQVKPSLITAMDVLAHTDTIHPFLVRLRSLMARSGAPFVAQSQYFPATMQRNEWDTIYHEHCRFYSVRSLQNLLHLHGIQIDDVEFNDFYGGSFLAYCSLGDDMKRFDEGEPDYPAFAWRVGESIRQIQETLRSMKAEGKRVAGIGAPMKSSTLLCSTCIGPETLGYLTEVNPLKVSTWSPGMHIPVVKEEWFFEDMPDVAFILSWNFAEQIMRSYRERGFTGEFVVPFPEVKVY